MITNNLLQPMASSRDLPELDLGDVVKSAEARCKQIQGVFLTAPAPPHSVSKLKKVWSLPQPLFHEILNLKERLVGSFSF